MDLDDARRYVADMLAGMDVRYDLGDDHRFVGTLCPDMKVTLERSDPDVVTAVTRSADLLREGRWAPARPRRPRGGPRRRGRVDRTGRHHHRPHGPGGRRRAARPLDGRVARALPTGQDLAATTLVRAPGTWFGHRPEHRINGRLRFARYEVGVR